MLKLKLSPSISSKPWDLQARGLAQGIAGADGSGVFVFLSSSARLERVLPAKSPLSFDMSGGVF